MSKIIFPSILGTIIIIAGVFAFAPVNQASTVHDTILGSIEIRDIYADIGTARSNNNNAVTFDFLLVDRHGDAVTGLTNTDFTANFTTGTASGPATIEVIDSGSGAYQLTIEPTVNWDAERTSIVLTVMSAENSASALLVVDIT